MAFVFSPDRAQVGDSPSSIVLQRFFGVIYFLPGGRPFTQKKSSLPTSKFVHASLVICLCSVIVMFTYKTEYMSSVCSVDV